MARSRNTTAGPEADTLDAAARAMARAEAALERAREHLQTAVVAAVAAGMSKAEAGRRAGYSREWADKLIKRRRAGSD